MAESFETNRWLTIPNAITSLRILGSPMLVVLATADQIYGLVALTVCLVFTEWLDGYLARRSHVTSAVGARLDTVADAIFYWSLLIALVVLRPAAIGNESIWIAAAISCYAISWLASLAKFRCLPSYHTWAAKGRSEEHT
ncbi:MAG: CDP-alcohol phosphatidyltransferase family protein, partial [Planctomycetales bacterium]|nr:CDP-alcohol phosphatidyltransferase family protein [Planctomycetales bacterium]